MLAVVGGVGFAGAVVEVALADDLGRKLQVEGDAGEDVFDDDHALRAAEAAEGGVRGGVGFADLATEADVGDVVGVVEMEEAAVVDGLGEIERPAAVGEEIDLGGVEFAIGMEADGEAGEEGVAFAGGFDVFVAVELDADGLAGLQSGEGGEGSPGIALGFFATEAAAHARAFDNDLIAVEVEDFGDDGLDLAGVLGGALDEDAAFAIGCGAGGVGFEVEVFLAADVEGAGELEGGVGQGGVEVATDEEVGVGVEGLGGDGGFDAEEGREGFVGDGDEVGGEARGFGGGGDNGGDELAVVVDLIDSEEGFVVTGGAGVVEAGDVGGGEDGLYARGSEGGGEVGEGEICVGVRGANESEGEGAGLESDVVGVAGGAGDVGDGGLVGAGVGVGLIEGGRDGVWDGVGLAGEEFLEEVGDEGGAEGGGAAEVVERGEFAGEEGEDFGGGGVGERGANEGGFGGAGAGGRGGDTAVGEACGGDEAGVIGGDAEGGGDRGDVHFPALGDFVESGATGEGAGEDDGGEEFVGLEDGLAIASEEIVEWKFAGGGGGGEDDGGFESEQDGSGVADGRGGDEVAAEGGAVADLAGGEPAQHGA